MHNFLLEFCGMGNRNCSPHASAYFPHVSTQTDFPVLLQPLGVYKSRIVFRVCCTKSPVDHSGHWDSCQDENIMKKLSTASVTQAKNRKWRKESGKWKRTNDFINWVRWPEIFILKQLVTFNAYFNYLFNQFEGAVMSKVSCHWSTLDLISEAHHGRLVCCSLLWPCAGLDAAKWELWSDCYPENEEKTNMQKNEKQKSLWNV